MSSDHQMFEPILEDDAPWKKRFRLPRVIVSFAPCNPSHAMVASNQSGKFELYAYDIAADSLRQVTDRPSGTVYGSISPDGKHIFYMNDKEGNETGHIVRVPFGGGGVQDLTPSMPDYTLAQSSFNGSGSHFGLTVPGKEGFDSYDVEVRGGLPQSPRMINRSQKEAFGPFASFDGRFCTVVSSERFGGLDYTMTSFETSSGKKLHEIADESSRVEPADFAPRPGDNRLLAMSNVSGVMRPLVWDLQTGKRTDLKVESLEGDVVGFGWSPNAEKVLLCQTNRATTKLWVYDLGLSKLHEVHHPEGTIASACFNGNDSLLMAWQDSTHPNQILSMGLDRSSGPGFHLAQKSVPFSRPWKQGSFESSDGEEIQCWYATPEGQGPFDTIFDTHGGPTGAQFNVFSPRLQVWLDHGFAVVSVNYRGSTTFGKDFEKKINGDIGHWEVEDMVAARRWLVSSGISKEDGIYLTGWSYGGYLTLQAMGVHPGLWAGGMGGVVVADWVTEYEDEPEAMRGYDVALHGGPPSQMMDEYKRASPINYVERLAAPLLIIQGKNDVRDPPRQVELYETKAKTLGKDVEVVWFDTGHAGSGVDVELAIRHHEHMLRWMQRVKGGKPEASSQD